MVKQTARLDGEEVSGSRIVEITREEAVLIQKAALVMLIHASPKTRLAKVSLPERYTVDHIRAVYQNLPEFDEESKRARDVITRAAQLMIGPVSQDHEQKARALIDAWRDEWHLEPEPELDGGNSKIYESLVSHVATALQRAATPPDTPAVAREAAMEAAKEWFWTTTANMPPAEVERLAVIISKYFTPSPAPETAASGEPRRCVKCRHHETVDLHDEGECQVRGQSGFICGCRCEFPAPRCIRCGHAVGVERTLKRCKARIDGGEALCQCHCEFAGPLPAAGNDEADSRETGQHSTTCARWVPYDEHHRRYDNTVKCDCDAALRSGEGS